jgi:hydrogenase-4 component H
MAAFDRKTIVEYQEKELLICESCGAIITTVEHLHFMHRKLGPKAFSSILNLNILNSKLKLAEGQDLSAEIKETLQRKDMFNIICPNCLRQITVKYLFKGA